jgi:hypothetical protein
MPRERQSVEWHVLFRMPKSMSRVLWLDDSPATVRGCPVLVHRAAALLRAFFGPYLTMTPLRFANPSPPSGWIEDFHLQAEAFCRRSRLRPSLNVTRTSDIIAPYPKIEDAPMTQVICDLDGCLYFPSASFSRTPPSRLARRLVAVGRACPLWGGGGGGDSEAIGGCHRLLPRA